MDFDHTQTKKQLILWEVFYSSPSFTKMPSIILPSDLDKDEVSLIENIQREDLKTTEEAIAYNNLIEKNKYSHEQLASIVGKSRSHVTNTLRILNLDKFFLSTNGTVPYL